MSKWKEISDILMEGNKSWENAEKLKAEVIAAQEISSTCLTKAMELVAVAATIEGEIPSIEAIAYSNALVGFELNYPDSGDTKYYYAFEEGLQDEKSRKTEKAIFDARNNS